MSEKGASEGLGTLPGQSPENGHKQGVAEAESGRMQTGEQKIYGQKLTIVRSFCLVRMHFRWSISDHGFFEPT